uniref:C2H2-type domain-containing protein n=1 Tax=Buteo japonicus TaxID=224669 RepID=A0A8B9Z1E5_9AVES
FARNCSLTPPGNCILSDNEEGRGIPEDIMQEVLPQLPEAHSPDRGAATPGRQQKVACNKPPHQKRGSKKLALIADGQKLHTEEKPYKCTECGKGFKGCSRLLNHLQTHTREKTFECVECGKSFSRKANLVVHQRIHTGERPYKCKECEKTFSRTSNLICGNSFHLCSNFVKHQRIHLRERPSEHTAGN